MSGRMSRRERKVVTVVFCDLVGFTARAESMDPRTSSPPKVIKAEPVPVWQAAVARARFDVDVAHEARSGSSGASASWAWSEMPSPGPFDRSRQRHLARLALTASLYADLDQMDEAHARSTDPSLVRDVGLHGACDPARADLATTSASATSAATPPRT